MSRIKVTNTSIIVEDYDLHSCEGLERYFQIYDPVTHKISYKGFYYDEENRKLYLPAGMDIWFVRRELKENYYDRITNTNYQSIPNIQIKYKPRDEEQIQALKFTCGVNEYEANANCNQLSINLTTGKGKTYVSIATICFFKIKSMIITASNSLLSQWKSEILKYTNLRDQDVITINGSDFCNMILIGSSGKANNGKIFLCSHGTLRSFGDRYGWNKVTKLFDVLGVGMKFYDEAHTSYDNMMMIDFFTNTYRTYYVTATPGRSNWQENKIFQISLKNVPSIDLFDENNDPHTRYIAIKWNSNPSAQQISACKHRFYKFDRNKYMDYLTKKPEFYQMMRIVMDMVKKCSGRVLMYIGTNDSILRVYYWICQEYPEYIGDVGVFTSLVDKEDKMEERQKRILLSTTKSAGLGEHIEGLKMTIVIDEPFKSSILARQTLGRTRDDNTLYIEMVDLGFLYTKKYYYAKLPVFNKYALEVSDSTIDSYEMERRAEVLIKERTHYQQCPIKMVDNRFDFNSVLPKWMKKENNGIIKPIRFLNEDTDSKL